MKGYRIPFSRPRAAGEELRHVAQTVREGYLSGDGPFTRRSSQLLEELLGVPRVLLTTSCTHALEMCALLLDLRPGDEFLVPSFAFVTTAGAFTARGAIPRFVDVRPDTWNLDESRIREALTPRTRAIVVLHYGGVACEMDEIGKVAGEAGVPVIEDAAHALFGAYRGRPLGTLGALGALSFHETKNLSCGEGGALLVNEERFVERAEIIREKGTDRSRFFRGEVDRYTWVDQGSSYLPSEILAAFLWGQLEVRDEIQRGRERVWRRYAAELADWAERKGVVLPRVPAHCTQPYHLFALLLPSMGVRDALIAHCKARGILAVFHYLPLHLSPMGRRFGGRPGDCPVTEDVSDRILRLPLYPDLSESEQGDVIGALLDFEDL